MNLVIKMKRRINRILISNKCLYVAVRCLYSFSTKDFQNLIYSYYAESQEMTSLLIEHSGELCPRDTIYWIQFYRTNEKRKGPGFFAMMRRLLEMLNFADTMNLIPVVEWGEKSAYYDHDMDAVTHNVFEYYFQPVSNVDCREVSDYKNIIKAKEGNGTFLMPHASSFAASYLVTEEEIEQLGYIYGKYIHLNTETKEYLEKEIKGKLRFKRTLGLHVRGTDFNVGFKDHPIVISPTEFLNSTLQEIKTNKYEQVFLATDDQNVLRLFQKSLGDTLVYYEDTARSDDNVGVHSHSIERPKHFYRLGLEVLRDVYTLANCEGLICGLSQVAFAARYIKKSLGHSYGSLIILNHGVKSSEQLK